MAGDARALLDHLGVARADVMGYSMGARITAWLAVESPERVRSAILGGLGIHLVDGVGLPREVAQALEAPSIDDAETAQGRIFRLFAEQTPLRPSGARGVHPRLAPDAERRTGRHDHGAGADRHRHEGCGLGRRRPACRADPRRARWSIFRSAITCSRSATRSTSRRCWTSSANAPKPLIGIGYFPGTPWPGAAHDEESSPLAAFTFISARALRRIIFAPICVRTRTFAPGGLRYGAAADQTEERSRYRRSGLDAYPA